MNRNFHKNNIKINFDKNGLIPIIIQDANNGIVLSLFYANKEAITKMHETEYLWRYSRSQKKLMKKGESSGNVQKIVSISEDCEGNSLLIKVVPTGYACHTGKYSCFGNNDNVSTILTELIAIIKERKINPKKNSYTSKIVCNRKKIISKLNEECNELIEAEAKKDIVWEAADLFFFMLVYLENRKIEFYEILEELKRRRK